MIRSHFLNMVVFSGLVAVFFAFLTQNDAKNRMRVVLILGGSMIVLSLVLAYVVLIFYLSSLSQIPWAAAYPDYLEHSVEYLGLAVLMARALNNGLTRSVSSRTLLIAFGFCVSDAIGAGTGLLALYFGHRLLYRRSVL